MEFVGPTGRMYGEVETWRNDLRITKESVDRELPKRGNAVVAENGKCAGIIREEKKAIDEELRGPFKSKAHQSLLC